VSPFCRHRRLIVALFNIAKPDQQQAREAANGSSIGARADERCGDGAG
jgi:hypothetical protein